VGYGSLEIRRHAVWSCKTLHSLCPTGADAFAQAGVQSMWPSWIRPRHTNSSQVVLSRSTCMHKCFSVCMKDALTVSLLPPSKILLWSDIACRTPTHRWRLGLQLMKGMGGCPCQAHLSCPGQRRRRLSLCRQRWGPWGPYKEGPSQPLCHQSIIAVHNG